jgi:hypothetical protein
VIGRDRRSQRNASQDAALVAPVAAIEAPFA